MRGSRGKMGALTRRANPAFLFTSGGGVPFLHSLRFGGGQGGGAPCQSPGWAVATPGRLAVRLTELSFELSYPLGRKIALSGF